MSLEQFSYLAQIVGTGLVIVSLFYVARQLRQNTEMARVAAGARLVQLNFSITEPLVSNREVAEVWLKGESHFDVLDEVDKRRLIFFEQRAIWSWHYLFQLNQQGLLPASEWTVLLGLIQVVRSRQSLQAAWGVLREGCPKPFRDFMDARLML